MYRLILHYINVISGIMTVEYLLAAGLLQQANIIAEIGIKESRDFKSKAFELKFGGLSLLSQVGVSKFDELYTALLNYQKMVAQEQRLHLDNYGFAECWDMIGDIVTLIAPDKHEVIAIAYDQAYDFISKFLEPKSGFKIPNASHSYYHARKARITIALAEIMYRNHQQGVILKSKAQYRSDISRAFSDALVAEVAVGGTDYAVLKTSFEGLLAIAIEEGDEFSARRLSHCLSYVAKLEMKSASKKYDDISARPLSASGTSDFIASQWVLFKKGASLTLDQFFSMEDYTDLDQPSLTHILNMRQGIIQMRNTLAIYTSDSLRQTAEIRLRRFNYYLMNVATAPTFKQKLCFSNIMFPSVVVQTSIDYTMASPKLQASFNVANIKSQDMIMKNMVVQLIMHQVQEEAEDQIQEN
ncbi:hypothetical protein HDU79_005776 [Rhizoclosmatium sp. JEL0117]|nr:hypothetical protein HDU79_005776 [Rhizoclosmatium sp. JEL0117]